MVGIRVSVGIIHSQLSEELFCPLRKECADMCITDYDSSMHIGTTSCKKLQKQPTSSRSNSGIYHTMILVVPPQFHLPVYLLYKTQFGVKRKVLFIGNLSSALQINL